MNPYGRPRLKSPEESKAKPQHQVRANEKEWLLVKEFCKMLNKGKISVEEADRFLDGYRSEMLKKYK